MMVYLSVTSGLNLPGFYYWENSSSTWKPVGSGKFWNTLGNAGTNATNNFVGTTDDNDLIFKRSNARAGILGVNNTGFGYNALRVNTGTYNIAVGVEALATNGIGTHNAAVGAGALFGNTSGNYNTGFGDQALATNSIANNNTAIGSTSLFSNVSGYSNTAMGVGALYSNTVRNNLVAVGDSALYKNGIGATGTNFATRNTALGSKALFNNTTGFSNTATGNRTLFNNTTGQYNTATGSSTLTTNTTGTGNAALGASALVSNTTGGFNTAVGSFALPSNITGGTNVAIGAEALYTDSLGSANVAIGMDALFSNGDRSNLVAIGDSALLNTGKGATLSSHGTQNTGVGSKVLLSNTLGYNNTGLGFQALYKNITGNNNVAIGNQTGYETLGSGNVFIGNTAGVNESGSNKLYITNSGSDATQTLLYGEFDNKLLRSNGRMEINSDNSANDGLRVVKNHATGVFQDLVGVYGQSNVDVLYGIGIKGNGGYIGVDAQGGFYGVQGIASGPSTVKIGVRGIATGAGFTNYGVYGEASGASSNFAGYFYGDVNTTGASINKNASCVILASNWTVAASGTGYAAGTYFMPNAINTFGVVGDTRLMNQGLNYNATTGNATSTGVFTAPVTGFYTLTFRVKSIPSGRLRLAASINGELPDDLLDEIITGNCANCDHRVYSMTIYLQAGDTHRVVRHTTSVSINTMIISYRFQG